jgi:ribose transport system substrate-binding protein
MKKIVIALVVVCIAATMMFVGVSCKAATTETTAAGAETTAAVAAAETTAAAAETTATPVAGKELKIVHIPKVVHPWFEIVQVGAERMAKYLTENTDTKVSVEYIAPATADVAEQNNIMEQAAAKGCTGIFIDPLDEQGNKQVFDEIRAKGILITVYDCSPFGDYTSVAASAEDSAMYTLTRLLSLIGEKGKVAVMQGMPTSPSHKQRYEVLMRELKKYPNITVVDGGVDNDDMETARQQASATIAANPDLAGYIGCDAAYPVGVSQAIKEAGKVGVIKVVGLGEMVSILDYVKEGVLESTVYVAPDMQGAYSVMLHYMANAGFYKQGIQIPKFIDIGCSYIDKTNVDEYLAMFKK